MPKSKAAILRFKIFLYNPMTFTDFFMNFHDFLRLKNDFL